MPFTDGAMWQLSVPDEIRSLLDDGAAVAVGVSGGKDSHALAFAVSDYLKSMHHTGPLVLAHADLGLIEWKDSLPVCEKIARQLNVPLEVVRGKAGGLIERWETRWANNVRRYLELSCVRLILPWSSAAMRFCTSEMKTSLICRRLRFLFPGLPIISTCGIRAEESSMRAKAAVFSPQPLLTRRGVVGWDWRPLLHWKKEDVFSYLEAKGQTLHEAYTKYGCSRVSCTFCILASGADLKAAARCPDNEEVYRKLVDLETRSTFSFQSNRWLGDVAPHLLDSATREALEEAKSRGKQRMEAEALIPKHLLFTAGWPQVLPTWDEAALLGKVREVVCGVIGVPPTYIHAEEVMGRYRALLAQRQGEPMLKQEELFAA